MADLGFYHNDACSRHDTGWRHPEHQGRLRGLMGGLERAMPRLQEHLEAVEGRPSDRHHLERVHDPEYVDEVRGAVERAAESGGSCHLDPDTVVSAGSWDAARAAAGCAADAVEAVSAGKHRSAFCAVRPPGHHATPDRAMGFCLFNSAAASARYAVERGLAERVLIVDWDVHHGNGTQEIFYRDPSVFYFSIHQSPFYPGTGDESERGEGPGEGTTLNRPMRAGREPGAYVEVFSEGLGEFEASGFEPGLVLISCGFDGSADDPLAGFTLQDEHYRAMTREVVRRTSASAGGKVVSVLEGGYDPDALGRHAVAHMEELVASTSEEAT